MKLIKKEKTLSIASAKAGMDEKTARKYWKLRKLPSQCAADHAWRTRKDPFKDDRPWVKQMLQTNPGLEAKTLFEALQQDYPGKYSGGQLRTLQRRIKIWRATEGPGKEVFFPQVYHPGVWSESDSTKISRHSAKDANKEYLKILYLAARKNEARLNDALRALIADGACITADAVEDILQRDRMLPAVIDVDVDQVNIADYEQLLQPGEVMV